MEHRRDENALRWDVHREHGQHRTTVPGVLQMWSASQTHRPVALKEVIAIIRPARWTATKQRLQRLRIPAFTHQRVLGRGRERGLRYLPRHGALMAAGVRYLPKRMISWVVEDTYVRPLIDAIMDVNRTGQFGDGVIFVLPIDEVIRIRTDDRGLAAIQAEQPYATAIGVMQDDGAMIHAAGR